MNTALPEPGDTVVVENQVRTVSEIRRNERGDPIVVWSARNESGVCMVSVWHDWTNPKPEKETERKTHTK